MAKTPQKVTKSPKRQEAAREDRKKYINKLKESISNDAKKVTKLLAMQAMIIPMPPPAPPPLPLVPRQGQAMLVSMVLV